MLDLTGANLISYLLRVTQDIMNRAPRFRNTLGEVSFSSNNQLNFGDTQLIVKNVTTQGNRLSPDYFMCTRHGHAILAQVEDKDGQFLEFVTETGKPIDPGVYYINVDSVSEKTREVGLTLKKYKWREGKITNAFGSNVYFAPGIDANVVTISDSANPDLAIAYTPFGSYLTLITPVEQIVIMNGVTTLTPNVDYWAVNTSTRVLIQSTTGGQELANVPTDQQGAIVLTDSGGYQLRQGIDYNFYGGSEWIQLSQFTPAGTTINITASFRVPDISVPFGAVNPENTLPVTLLPGESLAPGEVFIRTQTGTVFNIAPTSGGDLKLPELLVPGGYAFYEVRIDTGASYQKVGKKQELNGAIIDGLWLGIGDRVVVGDQVAIIVSPLKTETYQVFGSKENLNFTLEVKANDLQTASDFSEILKQELLVWRRTNMSADGIEIFEAPREYQGEQRDPSGTAPRYTYSLRVEASADWKVFVPTVTRLVSYEITNTITTPDFPGKLQVAPRAQTMGAFQFLPSYA